MTPASVRSLHPKKDSSPQHLFHGPEIFLEPNGSTCSRCHLVAWIGGVGALSPTHVPGYAMRTYSGRPRGLPRDWGSGCGGHWRERVIGGVETLPEAGAERAVVDGAADLEQPVGATP